MKKFFSYLGYALLLAVIIALFTSTGKEQCKQYISEKLPAGSFVGLNVSEAPFKLLGAKLFGIYSVTYFKPSHLSLQQQAATTKSPAVAAIMATSGMQSETYIGMFNTFWKW
jgi:hypothetical protein